MIGRKSVIGISVLVALASCALAASSAFAKPGRVFGCNPVSGTYSDAHCVTNTAGGFKEETIATGTKTKITGGNAQTAEATKAASIAKLKGKLSGIATEVDCTTVTGTGELEQEATFVKGTGEINYSGCTVVAPAGRGCIVGKEGKEEKKFTTKPLKATSFTKAKEEEVSSNELKFEPASGTEFVGIPIEKCKENLPPTATYPVTGSLIGTTSGATTTSTHTGITTQATLFFGGNVAGLEGAITISMEGGNPLFLK